jgi:hypothetical protein
MYNIENTCTVKGLTVLMKGAKISISTGKNVNNEFIPGYSEK